VIEGETCEDCRVTPGPAVVRQVAHAQGCTPALSGRASERLIPAFLQNAIG